MFKKPDLKNISLTNNKEDNESEDELDLFLTTLEESEKKSITQKFTMMKYPMITMMMMMMTTRMITTRMRMKIQGYKI